MRLDQFPFLIIVVAQRECTRYLCLSQLILSRHADSSALVHPHCLCITSFIPLSPTQKKEERFLQEDRLKSLQEIEELKKLCCTEAEKAKQLRGDELAIQEQERKSTVNQFMVQIQELQHKVKIL